MPNPDPSTFQPPPALVRESDFTDPLQSGATWHFCFRAEPGLTTETKIALKTREYVTTYVDGPGDGKLPAPLPPVGSGENRREIVPSAELFQSIAALEVMHTPETDADRWNVAQWAHFSLIAPNAFEEAIFFLRDLADEAKTGAKNLPSPNTA